MSCPKCGYMVGENVVDLEEEKPVEEEPIDVATAEKWIGVYTKNYNELPSQTYEKSHRTKLEIPGLDEMTLLELAAIFAIRPKFLIRVGATQGQIKWLDKLLRKAHLL